MGIEMNRKKRCLSYLPPEEEGYLAAALGVLSEGARVEVAELVPGVLKWNREIIGVCAGEPLNDDRVEVTISDVGDLITRSRGASPS